MPVLTKLEKVTTARNIIAGLRKRYPPGAVLMRLGRRYVREDLIALFEEQLAAIGDVETTWAAWQDALMREERLRGPAREAEVAVRDAVYNQHGAAGSRDFGWEPPKKTGPKTVASKMAGIEKRAKKRGRS